MHRLALPTALLALAACEVNQTPARVLNPRDPSAVEQRDAEQEIAARVGAFREALLRGDRGGAVDALAPVGTAHVMGPRANDGRALLGPHGLRATLDALALPTGAVARTPDLHVEADAQDGTGWFATHLELFPVAQGGQVERLRVSGVFARQEGTWRLIEMHLSRPEAPPAPAPAPAADTTAAVPPAASPASGAAPREDG
ncbi:MAG TPA: nuclear transport factor 2 family protein [Longimicrobium sp.]|uniref:nuclear transport factor 2 family protein n=1 Tax=Longimicrobium sp. TaxID=2029185 RepID=UPI002ED77FDD